MMLLLLRQVDAEPPRLLLILVIGDAIEARCRATGDQGARTERSDGLTLAPGWAEHVRDRPVRRDDETDEKDRAKRDRRADLPEERRSGLRHGATYIPAGDVVGNVVAREAEQRDDDHRATKDWQHRLATDEAKPELEGDRPEQDRNQERGPAEQGEERGTPPLQDRALVCRERHCREHGERDDGDGADLVADA